MKTIALLALIGFCAVLASNPVKPTCPYSACYFFWVANFVPSTAAPQFDYYFDQVAFRSALPYGNKEVLSLPCNASEPTTTVHELGIGASGNGQQNSVFLDGTTLRCDTLYSFFASRKPNVNTQEVYQTSVRAMQGNPSFGYMSGLVFNGIYRGGNNVNVKYCDKDSATCTTDRQDQRSNSNVPVNTWNEVQLKMSTGFENPVTINGPNNVVLFNDIVISNSEYYQVWYFWGDNQDQTDFPLQGGVSPASFLTISMSVLVTLSVIVSAML